MVNKTWSLPSGKKNDKGNNGIDALHNYFMSFVPHGNTIRKILSSFYGSGN